MVGGNILINGTTLTNIDSHAVNWTTFNGGFNIADPTNTFTVSAQLAGAGSLTKSAAGTLLLTASNAHTGGTQTPLAAILSLKAVNLGGESGTLTLGGGTLLTTGGIITSRPINIAAAGGTFDTNSFTHLFQSGDRHWHPDQSKWRVADGQCDSHYCFESERRHTCCQCRAAIPPARSAMSATQFQRASLDLNDMI